MASAEEEWELINFNLNQQNEVLVSQNDSLKARNEQLRCCACASESCKPL